ncbi:AAA family ATPase [Clostridium sp. Cult3]|nr:ATP-binding protein [Clostridium sp. Cult3]MCF6461472.1 AAA family ATPase [Clostridium sp. Cult3]
MGKTLGSTETLGSQSNIKTCSECGGKKELIINIAGIEKKVPCLCHCESAEYKRLQEIEEQKQKMLRLEKLRSHSLMGKQFESCTFENFQMNNQNKGMYKLGRNYCENWQEMKENNMGLLLYGPPGTGKTFLAFCIANELLNDMVPVIAISSIGLLNRIKETYNTWGRDGEVEIINNLKNANLLVLDDLGAENNTSWAKEKIYEIIDSRYRDKKPCIITTNLDREGLKRKLTGNDGVHRTYDRIIEMCYPVEVKGRSRRADAARGKEDIIRKLIE